MELSEGTKSNQAGPQLAEPEISPQFTFDGSNETKPYQSDLDILVQEGPSQANIDISGDVNLNQANLDTPKVEELSPFQKLMKTRKIKFIKLNKIKTASELVQLIQRTYQYNEESTRRIFEQITQMEILDFIFSLNNEFLLTVATNLSYQCLDFLKRTNLGFKGICSRLGPGSKIAKEFVQELKKGKINPRVKEEILSILLYFNEEGVTRAVNMFGDEEMGKILRNIQQKAETDKDSDESDSEYSEESVALDMKLEKRLMVHLMKQKEKQSKEMQAKKKEEDDYLEKI